MTESAEDRSKRIFADHLNDYHWTHQLTVFYQYYDDRFNLLSEGAKIRRKISRKFTSNAFLWRIAISKVESKYVDADVQTKWVKMPYITFFTNSKIKQTDFGLALPSDSTYYVYSRPVSGDKLLHYAQSVKRDDPHDLNKYFNYQGKINRFDILNRNKLILAKG